MKHLALAFIRVPLDLPARVADRITAFSGSMWFVYIHIIWFSCWIGLGVEKYPYGF